MTTLVIEQAAGVRNTLVFMGHRHQLNARCGKWLSDDVRIKESTGSDVDAQEVESVLKPAPNGDRVIAPPELRRIQIVAPLRNALRSA